MNKQIFMGESFKCPICAGCACQTTVLSWLSPKLNLTFPRYILVVVDTNTQGYTPPGEGMERKERDDPKNWLKEGDERAEAQLVVDYWCPDRAMIAQK